MTSGPDERAPAKREQGETRPAPRRYHVALTAKEVLERLSEQAGVKAYERNMLPDFGGLIEDAEYTLELGSREFTMHCGPPAARGQSATGMLRLLYLRGRLSSTREGTLIELRFAYRRPRWALQRWVGFLALAGLGLVWVLVGPGVLAKKALLYGALALVLGPVIAHDLRRADRIDEQRRAMLNLIERTFGPIQLDDPHPDEPYRRRMLPGPAGPAAEASDEDSDSSDDAREPEEGQAGDEGDSYDDSAADGDTDPSMTPEKA
ncbi:MerC domain-containing protein [Enhygromyxa salina]|uniref:MerC domain-containing protein n=1 Tax=Enhygromyxa salina TaxID=215803 RepID=UPI0011B25794|nr:MerC domain-containing protein [Enhygromyxa salina]